MGPAILRQAVELIRLGRKETARQVLADLVQAEPHNEAAWLWLANTQSDDAGRAKILAACLKVIPESQAARQELEALGAGRAGGAAEANPSASVPQNETGPENSSAAAPPLPLPSHPGTPPQLPAARPAIRLKSGPVTKPLKISAPPPILPIPPDNPVDAEDEKPAESASPDELPQDIPDTYPYLLKVEHSELPELPDDPEAGAAAPPPAPDESPFSVRVEHPELPDLQDGSDLDQ
jgi:hypothetical protein